MSDRRRVLLWLSLLVAPGTLIRAADRIAPQIPLEAFFDYPTVSDPTISPDGTRIAFIGPYKGHTAVALYAIGKGEPEVVEAPTDGNVNFLLWKGNDRLLYAGVHDESEASMLASLDLRKHNVTRLLRGQSTNAAAVYPLENDVNHIGMVGGDLGKYGVFKVDVRNASGDLIRSTDGVTSNPNAWILDNAGVVKLEGRLVSHSAADVSIAWYYRQRRGVPFVNLAEFPLGDDEWDPQSFAPDNRTLYLISYEQADMGELRPYDCETHRMGPPLFHDPGGEIDHVIQDRTGRLLGVTYTTDRAHAHWFDPRLRAIQTGIDDALHATVNSIVGFDDAYDRFVIDAWSDRQPPIYYLLDTKTHTLSPLGVSRPGIRAEDMAPMRPISFTADDGLVIHGYLTLPLGAAGRQVPFVLLPHGGPAARDVWGFDPEVQFLANRGYGVLQVNYRGSTGYGAAFFHAGIGQWGRKMQDDLTDGVHWAIAQGYADPKRICIYGTSYGGYAALMGLEFTPELYKCGVNYAGVVNPAQMAYGPLNDNPFARYYDRRMMGGDNAELKRYSPINFVQKIQVPTLHAYGANDPRVDIHEWRDLKRQLERYHKPFSYIELPYEGHGFRLQKDRLEFYAALEKFLQAHL